MTDAAKTYGGSLYDLAKEEDLCEVILADLKAVTQAAKEIPDYLKMLSSPSIKKEERKALIREAWEGRIHKYTLNFMCILCDNDGINEISDCTREFTNRFNRDNGITEAKITSAIALDAEAQEKIKSAIEKKTGKTVQLAVKIDPDLVGGLRLEFEGKAYDGSVAYHLDAIKQILAGN